MRGVLLALVCSCYSPELARVDGQGAGDAGLADSPDVDRDGATAWFATASRDATIVDGDAGNFGGEMELDVDCRADSLTHALLGFDLGSVPSGRVVIGARLLLTTLGTSDANTFRFHRVVGPWEETSVTFATAPAYDAAEAGRFTASELGRHAVSVSTGIVQAWLQDGASNHGLYVDCAADEGGNGATWASREAASGDDHPLLEVVTVP